MSTRTPEGWASDANARALRVELSPDHTLLLPFDQFVFAEIRPHDGGQEIRAVFATHEVLIRGHSLRRLVLALQRLELALVTPLCSSDLRNVPDGQPVIRDLAVVEVKHPEAAMPGEQAA